MKNKTKILIVDDHSLILEGIKNIIKRIDFVEVIGTANGRDEALKIMEANKVDVLMTDVEMKEVEEGIELTKIVKKIYPKTKVMALTQHSEPWIISKLMKFDIDAIVLKSSTDSQEIQQALINLKANKKYYSSEVQKSFFQTKPNDNDIPYLTTREKQILILICKEYTTQKIAKEFHIVSSTVETHRRNLIAKLKVRSQSGLVREAIRYGFYRFE